MGRKLQNSLREQVMDYVMSESTQDKESGTRGRNQIAQIDPDYPLLEASE